MNFSDILTRFSLFLLAATTLTLPGELAQARNRTPDVRDRYIVVFKKDVTNPEQVTNDIAKTHRLSIDQTYQYAIKGFAARIPSQSLPGIRNNPNVQFITADHVVTTLPGNSGNNNGRGKPKPTPTPTSTPTPTPTPVPGLSVTVTSPNGGEILSVGQTYRITWDSSATIDTVTIGYKACDSCLDWIANNIPNTNSYDWTVNVGNTTNTQFRIYIIGYQTGVGSVSDVSDSPFTVLQPTPTPTLSPTPRPTATPIPIPTQAPQATPSGINRIGLNATNKGNGVTVAVIDTGIDLTHPDLAANIIANTTCVTGTTTGNDDNGHGSHVAGTIAALDNTTGVVGVAPDAKLVAVKVLNNQGSGTWSSVICGIDWVTAHAAQYNIKVANMSLGGGGTSDNNCGNTNADALHQAMCNSTAAGITYVVAAGNNNADASTFVPAAYDDTLITVSALADSDGQPGGVGHSTGYGPDDTFATFSNYGSVVDIGAPGANIYSTYKGGSYATLSGTSMATPHVTGSAALYIASHPGSSWQQIRAGLVAAAEALNAGHTDPSGLHPEPVVKANSL